MYEKINSVSPSWFNQRVTSLGTALIPGLPVFGEGETEQEAIEDLKTGIQLYIDQYDIEMLQEKIIAPSSLKTLPFAELVHG